MASRSITSFQRDEYDDWFAILECGHTQHVRHQPPWQNRPWVITAEGRKQKIGHSLMCKLCESETGK